MNNNSKILNMKYPIIQGGMGIGVSLGNLAGAVAHEGAMGVISSANPGYRTEDFFSNPREFNKVALDEEIKKAKSIAQGEGLIGVNIMSVINEYENMVEVSCDSGADAIISGAGLPLNLAELTKGRDIMIAPIVSSGRACNIIIRKWLKSADRLPDFIVVEGMGAGGHLGFDREDLKNDTISLEEILSGTLEVVRKYEEKYNVKIPVFVGGSVFDGKDIKKYRDLGAYGVQIGTRFIATEECDAHENFKNLILKGTAKDAKIIDSPVGMPGRALNTKLIQNVEEFGRIPPKFCINCIKTCDPKTTKYCITVALIEAAKGNEEEGLFFAGKNIGRINKITTVKELIDELVTEGGLK